MKKNFVVLLACLALAIPAIAGAVSTSVHEASSSVASQTTVRPALTKLAMTARPEYNIRSRTTIRNSVNTSDKRNTIVGL